MVKVQREVAQLSNRLAGLRVAKSKKPVKRQAFRETNANVPLQMAYTQRQNTGTGRVRMTFCDQLTSLTVGPATPTNTLYEYPLNPLQLGGRMQILAQAYQKFKFVSVKFSVGVNMPTTTSGNYTVAYTENPDQAFAPNITSQQVFALPMAVNKPWWQRGDSIARITDKAKWYNLDIDSSEIMQTTQGKFVVVNVSPPTTTAPVTVPIFMEYTIEFSDAAIQNNAVAVSTFIFPAGTFTKTISPTTYSFAASAGEPAIPALTLNKAYYVAPEIIITDGQGDLITAGVIALSGVNNYVFAATMDEYNKNIIIGGPLFLTSFPVTRSVVNSPN